MQQDFHQRLQDALDRIPILGTAEGRDTLLIGIPSNIIGSLYRYRENKKIDLIKLIEQLDRLGTLEKDNVRPLLIFLKNAQNTVAGTLSGRILQDLIDELVQQDEADISPAPPPNSLPAIPEAFIFGGSDERLPYAFFEGALQVQKSIVRLRVPRIFGTFRHRQPGIGTGWLVTSQLLLTNYHVINARTTREQVASPREFRAQAEQTTAWFDYHTEYAIPKECPCVELVSADTELDYALLRLGYPANLEYRPPLTLDQRHQELQRANRLNIVQHSDGGILQYAVRNNFYIGIGENTNFIRYLTDTEGGASGSPVFNDDWLVVAMHHLAQEIPPASYKGETIRYHNEGIEIYAILNNLPRLIRQEIFEAQGW